ncbi:hypothetical protein P4193_24970 [Pseudomonas aeruginosa]|nr:hypothetical protein [Pseudomonas aeruginosa]
MDFFVLNVETPITISVTLGDLPVSLMDIDVYGEFLRGFNPGTGEVEDEPRAGLETVITLLLQVGADLEPTWTLFLSVRSSSNSNALFLEGTSGTSTRPYRQLCEFELVVESWLSAQSTY